MVGKGVEAYKYHVHEHNLQQRPPKKNKMRSGCKKSVESVKETETKAGINHIPRKVYE